MSSSIKVIFAFNKQSALAVADAQPKIAPPQPPAERNKSCPLDFWISPRMALIAIALLFCLTEALAPLIPPIQSPDEAAHLERAYLLSKGEIFLRTRDGITGGEIDTGLLSYMNSFLALPLNYEHKVKTVDLRRARKIQWTGVRRFDGLPNTAAYFPLPYTPQAVAFALSERAGLTVYQSYSLARILSLVVTLNLLWIACRIHPIPPVVAALFVMPMTLFQLASASLDAITFAMTAVTAGLFLRGADSRPFNGYMHAALALCTFSLATSRINMLGLTLLPLLLYRVRRNPMHLAIALVSAFGALSWIFYATVCVKGGLPNQLSPLENSLYYLSHPTDLALVVLNTFGNRDILTSYWAMFIGVLGWLDTPLDSYLYVSFLAILPGLFVLSVVRDRLSLLMPARLSLAVVSLVSFSLIFILELVAWTPFPAKVIDGVQGRYFIPVLILLGYAVSSTYLSVRTRIASWLLLWTAIGLSVSDTAPKLLYRYWMD